MQNGDEYPIVCGGASTQKLLTTNHLQPEIEYFLCVEIIFIFSFIGNREELEPKLHPILFDEGICKDVELSADESSFSVNRVYELANFKRTLQCLR